MIMRVKNFTKETARCRGIITLFLTGTAIMLSACETVAVVGPRPAPRVIAGWPNTCIAINDPAVRSRVLVRLEPHFRGPRTGRRNITLREHLRTHHHHVYDCGDVWRVVFVATTAPYSSNYVIIGKSGGILSQSF
jgi:hypothetical protein